MILIYDKGSPCLQYLFLGIRKKYSETLIPRIIKVTLEKTKEAHAPLMQYFGVTFVSYVGTYVFLKRFEC